MKQMLFYLLAITAPLIAQAEILVVGINNSVPANEVQTWVERLNWRDVTTGTMYFEAKVDRYYVSVDQTSPYSVVAIVEIVNDRSPGGKRAYLDWINKEVAAGVYTNFSNPQIGNCGSNLEK